MATQALERRLASLTLNSLVCPSCTYRSSVRIHRPSRRNASWLPPKIFGQEKDTVSTKTSSDYATKAPSTRKAEQEAQEKAARSMMATGKASTESIFGDVGKGPARKEESTTEASDKEIWDTEALLNVTDPLPERRHKWERWQVVKSIKKRGYLTKAEIIRRTERQCRVKSQSFKTSTKKLMHLARQIAGKPVDEAIAQMQFSKKRVAQDIRKHLEYSRDLAIVGKGMGLGSAQKQEDGTEQKPLEIELKNGKRKIITDRTQLYVDQAWVNKGTETSSMDFRGRGRVFRLTHRRARISVLLKEEATRVRLSDEIKKKRDNRKLWLHLPDRPITLQRQYPLW